MPDASLHIARLGTVPNLWFTFSITHTYGLFALINFFINIKWIRLYPLNHVYYNDIRFLYQQQAHKKVNLIIFWNLWVGLMMFFRNTRKLYVNFCANDTGVRDTFNLFSLSNIYSVIGIIHVHFRETMHIR